MVGGNVALIDAWNLSDQLATIANQANVTDDEIDKLLSRYENERIPVASREILESRDSAEQFHAASSMTIFVRNNILRMVNLAMRFDTWKNKQS